MPLTFSSSFFYLSLVSSQKFSTELLGCPLNSLPLFLYSLQAKNNPGIQTVLFETTVDLCRGYRKKTSQAHQNSLNWAHPIPAPWTISKKYVERGQIWDNDSAWLLSPNINTFHQMSYILMLIHMFLLKSELIIWWGFRLSQNPQRIKDRGNNPCW